MTKAYERKDHYFRRAKSEGRASRAYYKLEELDQKYDLLKARRRVLDLGAAPGSWSQYLVSRITAKDALVVACDLQPCQIAAHPHLIWVQGDLREETTRTQLLQHVPYHLIVSDIAPSTTGIRATDQARSLELCRLVLEIAMAGLAPQGALALKFFEGTDSAQLLSEAKRVFKTCRVDKPDSSRTRSFEKYLVCLEKL